MNVVSLTEPVAEPVTLEEMYAFLRLDAEGSPPTHPDDDMLRDFIVAARERAEAFTSRTFAKRELLYTQSFQNAWDAARGARAPSGEYTIALPRGPVLQVIELSYVDAAGAVVVADPTSYFVEGGAIAVPAGFYGVGSSDAAIRVRYLAGYDPDDAAALTGDVPKSVCTAIKIGVQLGYDELAPEKFAMYEKRFERLLWPYVVAQFA